MKKNGLPYLILFLLLIAVKSLSAQDSLYSFRFTLQPFSTVVKELRAKTGATFYYEPAVLDSLRFTIDESNQPLPRILELLFENKPYHFLVSGRNVYITERKYPVTPRLAADFFRETDRKLPPPTEKVQPEPDDQEATKTLGDQAENKLYEIGSKTAPGPGNTAIIAGYVRDSKSGEGLVGASVYTDGNKQGVTTDGFGYFSITLPKGRQILRISGAGMKATRRELQVYGNGNLTIELKENVPTLKTVVVVAEKNSNVRRMQLGVEKISIKTIKQVPVLLGEPDVLRVLQTLPGVTTVGEASTGFNVRGGSTDQNLVLLNEATIFNPSHLFGFFSAFNPEVIKNADLYKSSIPERYGGRLSSVLDITTRDGNSKKWTGSAGLGVLTSKLNIEGPIVKDKTTMLAGVRTTYSDWLLGLLPASDFGNSRASFYDLNLHLSHSFSKKDNLFITGYMSADKFRLNTDTTFRYANKNVVAKWKHVFSNKLYMTLTTGIDSYDYSVKGDQGTIKAYELSFGIQQKHFRTEFNYSPNNTHLINFGVTGIHYNIQPGRILPLGGSSLVLQDKIADEQGREMAAYFGDRINITDRFSLNAGIRFSSYQFLGPNRVYGYVEGLPRDQSTVKDSASYAKGKVIQSYQGPEWRLSMRYSLGDNASIKAGYNTLRQYLHLLSNTTAISPTDIWKLSDPYIKPQLGDQVSLGFYKDFPKGGIETSVEVYYKRMRQYLDYKSGAQIVMNPNMERDVITTKGKAYGAELMIRKNNGKLNGWISYTYSRVKLQMDDSLAGQQINKGKPYPANFDKPHALNVVSNYKFSHRYSVSMNVQYSTGRPITLPIAIFNLAGSQRVFYSDRNQYRIPDYFRMDFSVNIDGNHKVKQKTHNSWSLGAYNMTARKNPYSIYFVEENGVIKGYKLSVIGTIIPYVTLNIRF